MAAPADGGLAFVSTELAVVWIVVLSCVFVVYLTVGTKLGKYCPPATLALLIGVACGVGVRLSSPKLTAMLRFEPELFFFVLLPPIIWNAGFSLKKKDFFANFTAIIVFALLGTLVSAVVFGLGTYGLVLLGWVGRDSIGSLPLMRCLMYGALISSTDPVSTLAIFKAVGVPPLLHSLVFGESVLNDAAVIILFETIRAGYHATTQSSNIWLALFAGLIKNSISSIIVGVALSLVLARVMKLLGVARHRVGDADASVYDVSIVMLGGYLSYIVAVGLGLSGIVALFVSGIIHSHYTLYNVSEEAASTLRLTFEPMSMLAESFTFAYMGLQVALGSLEIQWGLMLSALPLCILSRIANIVPLAALLRALGGTRIPWAIQLMQVFSGTRGSMSYALVVNMPAINAQSLDNNAGNPYMESSTLFIAIVTTVLVGSLTAPMLKALGIEGEVSTGEPMSPRDWEDYAQLQNRVEEEEAIWTVKTMWRNIDSRFMKPIFGGRGHDRRGERSQGARLLDDVRQPSTQSNGP